jgi:hypothetical protein
MVVPVVGVPLVGVPVVGVPLVGVLVVETTATGAGAAFGAGFAATGTFDDTFTPALGAAVATIVVLVFAAAVAVVVGLEPVFVLPLPLVLAVALLTGASRETVLEPARLALAEVTFGIAHRFY